MNYSFKQFIAALLSSNFDKIELERLKWAEAFIRSYTDILLDGRHEGKCKDSSFPCSICTLQQYLDQYKEYCTNEIKFRNDNNLPIAYME
jgi:hypothetical protein